MDSWYYYLNPRKDHPNGGTVHLVSVDDYCRRIADNRPIVTLCNGGIGDMQSIDETASGRLATCKTCRSRAGIDKR